MDLRSFHEAERKRLDKIFSFRLPHSFFKLGIWLFIASFIMLIISKIGEYHFDVIRIVVRNVMLISLLFCSLARDKVEDEMNISLRAKSYSLAFVVGVVYAILMPFIEEFMDYILNKNDFQFENPDAFPVLIFMLSCQVLFYYTFKKYS